MFKARYFEDAQFREERKVRFAAVCGNGACFSREIVHNGGWYNQLGEEIGWGDMTMKSMDGLAEMLVGNDLIVVTSESGRCGFDHPDHRGHQMKYSWDYLLEHVLWVLRDGRIYRVYDLVSQPNVTPWDDVPVHSLQRDQVLALINEPEDREQEARRVFGACGGKCGEAPCIAWNRAHRRQVAVKMLDHLSSDKCADMPQFRTI